LEKINFIVDENKIYGVWASYINLKGCEVKGWKIMSRIKPRITKMMELIFDNKKQEVIKYLKIGVD
jgi:hypothetical protein